MVQIFIRQNNISTSACAWTKQLEDIPIYYKKKLLGGWYRYVVLRIENLGYGMGEAIRVTSLLGLNLSNVKNQIFSRTIYQYHPSMLIIA